MVAPPIMLLFHESARIVNRTSQLDVRSWRRGVLNDRMKPRLSHSWFDVSDNAVLIKPPFNRILQNICKRRYEILSQSFKFSNLLLLTEFKRNGSNGVGVANP
jgi:hypothetical protein